MESGAAEMHCRSRGIFLLVIENIGSNIDYTGNMASLKGKLRREREGEQDGIGSDNVRFFVSV